MRITNQSAADEAVALARNLHESVLTAFADLAEGVDLARLLAVVHIRLREVEADPNRLPHPHETVELMSEGSRLAGFEYEGAVRELTTAKTAGLGVGLTSHGVALRRKAVRADLTARRDRLSRPLGMLTWPPSFKARRCAQRDALQADALSALNRVPLPERLFDAVATSILAAAGLDAGHVPELDEIRSRALARHCAYLDRWETVLMLVWEAIATEDGGAEAELDTGERRARFSRAREQARRDAEARTEEARLRAEKVRQKAESEKRALVQAEIEMHRKEAQGRRNTFILADDIRGPDYGAQFGS